MLVFMQENFLQEIDAALPQSGYSDRAKFIRDAVYEKLQALGFKLPIQLKLAPTRIGARAHVQVSTGHIQIATGNARIQNGIGHVTKTKRKSKIG